VKDALGDVQSVLVLGGDSDIAIATCRQLIERRTRKIILAGRDVQRLESRAAQLRGSGDIDITCLHFDAIDFESHDDFVAQAFEGSEDIDLVLLAFGVLGNQQRDEHSGSLALHVIQANFSGAVSVLIPVAEKLVSQGHGTLVVLSSVAAERARRSNFIYGASKAGLDWFAQGLSDALRGTGVHVLVVRPGFATTKMTSDLKTPPMASTPDEIATAIVEGVRNGRDIVWVPRKLRVVMAILRHLPGSVFRRLPI
jgi:decaprenylphospho-beta-D-erythro-pentofuranosid-2-ulose 2-reductase